MKINLTEDELKYLTKILKLLNYCEKNLEEIEPETYEAKSIIYHIKESLENILDDYDYTEEDKWNTEKKTQ